MNDLYQENILEHASSFKNRGELACDGCYSAKGNNPACGDSAQIFLNIDEQMNIQDAKYTGTGCAISQASMSILIESIQNKNLKYLRSIMPGDIYKMLGISITPARVNCALLSYRALEQVLIKYDTVNKGK